MPSSNPPPRRAVSLRLGILRLRLGSWVAARRLHALQDRADRARGKKKPLRRWPYVATLVFCFAAAVSAVVVSILAQGAPILHTLDGRLPSEDKVVILDPDRRDETRLAPGYLYDRPIAAVQTGFAPVLLRMRLEETLLTASRDAGGRVVVTKPVREPGENWDPRTIPQAAALEQLKSGGYCRQNDSWEDALKLKLPARRLPGGDSDGGRLLVFEKKTIIADPDSPIPDVDISVLRPEDIEEYDLGKVIYSYTGFYFINEAGTPAYQPLHIAVDGAAPRKPTQKPPNITSITYDFYQWDVTQSNVHLFNEDPSAPVNLQPGELRPITEWMKPEDAWFVDADGWVYYGRALDPGVMTPLLLKSLTVWPESPLLQDENRYRLSVRAQSAPLVHDTIVELWHSGAPLGGLGGCYMTNEAAEALFGRAYPGME